MSNTDQASTTPTWLLTPSKKVETHADLMAAQVAAVRYAVIQYGKTKTRAETIAGQLRSAPDVHRNARNEFLSNMSKLRLLGKLDEYLRQGNFLQIKRLLDQANSERTKGTPEINLFDEEILNSEQMVEGFNNLLKHGKHWSIDKYMMPVRAFVALCETNEDMLPLTGIEFPEDFKVTMEAVRKGRKKYVGVKDQAPPHAVAKLLAKAKLERVFDVAEVAAKIPNEKYRIPYLIEGGHRQFALRYRAEAIDYFRKLCSHIEEYPEREDRKAFTRLIVQLVLMTDPEALPPELLEIDRNAAAWDEKLAVKIAEFFAIREEVPKVTIKYKSHERDNKQFQMNRAEKMLTQLETRNYQFAAAEYKGLIDKFPSAKNYLTKLVYDYLNGLIFSASGDGEEWIETYQAICREFGFNPEMLPAPRSVSIYKFFIETQTPIPDTMWPLLCLPPAAEKKVVKHAIKKAYAMQDPGKVHEIIRIAKVREKRHLKLMLTEIMNEYAEIEDRDHYLKEYISDIRAHITQ